MDSKFFKLIFIASLLSLQFGASAQKKTFSIMTYNIENFFDTIHDVVDMNGKLVPEKHQKLRRGRGEKLIDKNDYAYLPLALKQGKLKDVIAKVCPNKNFYYERECFKKDWNAEVYKVKLENMITGMMHKLNGCGADIIMLQEVENIRVLNDIFRALPKKCGYKKFGLIEGPDHRGIDIGFISRFPVASHKLIDYPLQPGDRKRRSHYKVTFKVANRSVSVVGNHWPSLGTKNPIVRLKAAKLLVNATQKMRSSLIVAVGDFNTSINKEPAVFSYVYKYFQEANNIKGFTPNKLGSHYYRGEWNFLDHILVAKKSLNKATAKFKPLWSSFYVVNKGLLWNENKRGKNGKIKYKKGTPRRFSDYFKAGFSDHLPLVMSFEIL